VIGIDSKIAHKLTEKFPKLKMKREKEMSNCENVINLDPLNSEKPTQELRESTEG
jgi:hypothetical protein